MKAAAAIKPGTAKPQRCAIYTRKSTEHNLDLAFNSLDAQREACEAYIKSQAHEGWTLASGRFDDGGLSGASLDRPALQTLLNLVRSRRIDIVVVYKVDRLTRSLADFAKLVEVFDAHGVSFVSVTQSFNTTSSMGRLTLNVLLSFAQFEREVIGERVRDKISASKRKGIWVGGPVPLGYRSIGKKLEVAPEEAAVVRKIFEEYLKLGSIGDLAVALDDQGLRPKRRRLADGSETAATRFTVGPLAHMLKNRFYIGEVSYRGEVHKGEHAPILDRDLFEAVQATLAQRGISRTLARSRSPSFLAGLLFDDRGNPMSPSHANKKGVRYRYYVSQALLQKRGSEAGSVSRVSAPDVEQLVCQAVRNATEATMPTCDHDLAAGQLVASQLVADHVHRVTIGSTSITITLRSSEDETDRSVDQVIVQVPFTANTPIRKGVIHAPEASSCIGDRDRDVLLRAIVRARTWTERLLRADAVSIEAIAAAEKLGERHVRRLLPLAYLSPTIVRAIADCMAPTHLSVSSLTQALPYSWSAQQRMLAR